MDQNQAVLRAADEDAAIAMANLRPVIQYTASYGRNVSQLTAGGGHAVGLYLGRV